MASDSATAPSDAVARSSSSKKADGGPSSKAATSAPAEGKATTAAAARNKKHLLSASGTVRDGRGIKKAAAAEQGMAAKLAATKRKLREGYRRFADAKRRRRLQVIGEEVARTCCAKFDLCETACDLFSLASV